MFASVSKQQILYKALKRDREFVVTCVCVCVCVCLNLDVSPLKVLYFFV